MCKVSWCYNRPEEGKNGRLKKYCSTHIQYKKWVSNASTRPWLFYKLEKILEGKGAICEKCGDDIHKRFPDRTLRQVIQGMEVDHINPKIKGTEIGEQPSNYQLICKYCHLWKSQDEDDFKPKKYKQ